MNPMDFLKNFQNMQSKLSEAQERLRTVTATGSAGGDMVRVELNGQFELLSIQIDKDVVDPNDVQMLQDLVHAAFADASAKVRDKIRDQVSSMTGDMELPPGMFGA
ncbi:MAG: YbaB/EbfC family nucleoid-associated protein [Spirochaetes bacterium]|nr:YbaB/EbfC family nucleoid-associated protein [Spirochaetota bacterium]